MPTPSSRQSAIERASARIGTVVQGKYRLDKLIGIGGMAAVYAATDRTGQRVAVKYLHEVPLDSDGARRFRREVYVANTVGHPGVLRVSDDGVDEGYPFFVMPFLDGETLRARWERANRRLPMTEVSILMLDVLDVLAIAHTKGIVHRDIKPENLFITTKGEVRVLDFGIARLLDDEFLTMTGRALGTLAFMPPEQARGERDAIGPHSDCWAVGATIFILLSGESVHPVHNFTAAGNLPARSLSDVVHGLPASLTQCIDKALAFDLKARWPSATEMQAALRTALEEAAKTPFEDVAARVRASVVADYAAIGEHHAVTALRAEQPKEVVESLPITARDPGERVRRDAATPSVCVETSSLQGNAAFNPRRRQIGRFAATLVLLMAVAMIVGAGRRFGRQPTEPSPLPATMSANAEAHAALEAGLQLWRDASGRAARKKFAEAARLDPGFALAHLYYAAAAKDIDPEARAHISEAQSLRARLSPMQEAMLAALEPLTHEPMDYAGTTRLLAELSTDFPQDGIVWSVRVSHDLRTRQPRHALSNVDHVPGALAHWFRARSELQQDDVPAGRASLQSCAKASPTGLDCLRWLALLEQNEGACEDAAAAATRMIALDHDNPDGYFQLARSELGRSHRTSAVHAILEDRWARVPDATRDLERRKDEFFLAVWDGHFEDAYKALAGWQKLVSNLSDAIIRIYPLVAQVELDLELGLVESARQTASKLDDASKIWVPSEYFDSAIETTRVLYLSGQIDRGAFSRRRARDEAGLLARGGYFAAPGVRWHDAYVQMVLTADDAKIAVAHRPEDPFIVEAVFRDVGVDVELGNMYLLAADTDNARISLRRAAKGCTYWKAIQGVRAHALYGEALSSAGSREACAEYGEVIERWGHDPRSRTARAAREAAKRFGCIRK